MRRMSMLPVLVAAGCAPEPDRTLTDSLADDVDQLEGQVSDLSDDVAALDTDLGGRVTDLEKANFSKQIEDLSADVERVAASSGHWGNDTILDASEVFLDFASPEFDTHFAVDDAGGGATTSSADAWKFVAPRAGLYQVTTAVSVAASSAWGLGDAFTVSVRVNQATDWPGDKVVFQTTNVAPGAGVFGSGTAVVDLGVDDYVQIVLYQHSDAALELSADARRNWVQVQRIGSSP